MAQRAVALMLTVRFLSAVALARYLGTCLLRSRRKPGLDLPQNPVYRCKKEKTSNQTKAGERERERAGDWAGGYEQTRAERKRTLFWVRC